MLCSFFSLDVTEGFRWFETAARRPSIFYFGFGLLIPDLRE
jgi:hypothetical protein